MGRRRPPGRVMSRDLHVAPRVRRATSAATAGGLAHGPSRTGTEPRRSVGNRRRRRTCDERGTSRPRARRFTAARRGPRRCTTTGRIAARMRPRTRLRSRTDAPVDELSTASMARHRIRHSPRTALGRPRAPSPTRPQPSPCRGAHVHPQHPPNTRQAAVRTRSLPRCDLWIPVIRCGRQNAPSPLSTGTCRTNHRTPGRTLASAPRFFLRVPTRV
jgi:hypothetical protein